LGERRHNQKIRDIRKLKEAPMLDKSPLPAAVNVPNDPPRTECRFTANRAFKRRRGCSPAAKEVGSCQHRGLFEFSDIANFLVMAAFAKLISFVAKRERTTGYIYGQSDGLRALRGTSRA